MVYKNLVIHPDTAMPGHLGACAADQQGKFMEFKKLFWKKGFNTYAQTRDPSSMSAANVVEMAKELGLDASKFEADMNGETCMSLMSADAQALRNFGVNGTPSFFVNGKFTMFQGPEAFEALIKEELAAVAASGVAPEKYYDEVVMAQGEKRFKSRAEAQ